MTNTFENLSVKGLASKWFEISLDGRLQIVKYQISTRPSVHFSIYPSTYERGPILGPIIFILGPQYKNRDYIGSLIHNVNWILLRKKIGQNTGKLWTLPNLQTGILRPRDNDSLTPSESDKCKSLRSRDLHSYNTRHGSRFNLPIYCTTQSHKKRPILVASFKIMCHHEGIHWKRNLR